MLRRLIVAVILTVWFFPPPAQAEAARLGRQEQSVSRGEPGTAAEAQRFADREQQAQELQTFEGGRGRGGGIAATTVIIILLLVIVLILII
jgi:hypothetical protein